MAGNKTYSKGQQTECGTQGIFIGFDPYCPGSWHIITSEDMVFDELISSSIATTWHQH
jgi:hypothetical protein